MTEMQPSIRGAKIETPRPVRAVTKRRIPEPKLRDVETIVRLLEDDLLDELVQQIPGKTDKLSHEAKVRQILEYLRTDTEHHLDIRGRSKVLPMPAWRGSKPRYLGFGPHFPLKLVTKHNADDGEIRYALAHSNHAFSFHTHLSLFEGTMEPMEYVSVFRDILPCVNLLGGAVLPDDFDIPDDGILVTDLRRLTFEKKLTMGKNARIIGLHPCGLHVQIDTLACSGDGSMPEWPMFSTSARSTNLQALSLVQDETPPGTQDEGVAYIVANFYPSTNGSLADPFWGVLPPEDGAPEDKVGTHGADGVCHPEWVFGELPKQVLDEQAEDGQSFDEDAGEAGPDGGDGGHGVAARKLEVTITTSASGNVRFEASGGNGAIGGKGGKGQTVQGGEGGDIAGLCQAAGGAPGQGGTADRGGRGGNGGDGGDGGDGHWLRLKYPAPDPEKPLEPASDFQYRACVRGGQGGPGGQPGDGGRAWGGKHGDWIGPFPTVAEYASGGEHGSAGSTGIEGARGRNGIIFVNGEQVVPPQGEEGQASWYSDEIHDYRWPVGTQTAGFQEDCWTE